MRDVLKKAVVLLSGGIDSSTALAIAGDEGFELYAISFDYGQRNKAELRSAVETAEAIGVREHKILKVDLGSIGGSSLTKDSSTGVSTAYVPARNTVFLSISLAWAEVLCARDIFIGVNVADYSGYPDCRPEYISAFEKLTELATVFGGARIHAPLMHMGKGEIIRKGLSLGIDYSMTQSCYEPGSDGYACGKCESCRIRLRGFEEAGTADPVSYRFKGLPKRSEGYLVRMMAKYENCD